MKKVEVIIRPEKVDAVIDALTRIGYSGVTISEVKGHGKQKGITRQWRGNEYVVAFLPKVKIEVVVLDEDMDRTVHTIVRKSRTGHHGDGKVFITDIAEAVRVRTGETGMRAI